MKSINKMLSFSLFFSGLLLVSNVFAADLPDLASASKPLANTVQADSQDAQCTECHDQGSTKPVLEIYQTKHGVRGDVRAPSCQTCHGTSEKHKLKPSEVAPDVLFGDKRGSSGNFANSEAKLQNTTCLSCHAKDAKRTHWEGSAHQANDVACASCHEVHTAHDKIRDKKTQAQVCFNCHKEQRAQSKKMSHHPIAEGKIACTDCHNTHGSAGPKLLKKNTVTETCYTCHAEKRGPFLFEHQPVTEDCSHCHTAHGSNITPLLKSRPPFQCSECHDGTHASGTPAGPNVAGRATGTTGNLSTNFTGRACLNCHSMIHGSNSPAGGFLQR